MDAGIGKKTYSQHNKNLTISIPIQKGRGYVFCQLLTHLALIIVLSLIVRNTSAFALIPQGYEEIASLSAPATADALTIDMSDDGLVGKTMQIEGELDDLILGTPWCLNEKEVEHKDCFLSLTLTHLSYHRGILCVARLVHLLVSLDACFRRQR